MTTRPDKLTSIQSCNAIAVLVLLSLYALSNHCNVNDPICLKVLKENPHRASHERKQKRLINPFQCIFFVQNQNEMYALQYVHTINKLSFEYH